MSTRSGAGREVGTPRRQIAVVGGSRATVEVLEWAERAGAAIAAEGAVLVCGGLGGVMEASARGAYRAGGLTLGILPGSSREGANPFLHCAVATGLGDFRNFLVVAAADALVALPGRFGTLSEIAMALTLAKPVIGLGTWEIEGVRPANDPEDAVRLALEALR